MDAEELFSKFHGDPFVLQMIAYALAIETEAKREPHISSSPSDLYSKSPLALVTVALKATDSLSDGENGSRCYALRKYLLILSDFVQAKTLDGLGKGWS